MGVAELKSLGAEAMSVGHEDEVLRGKIGGSEDVPAGEGMAAGQGEEEFFPKEGADFDAWISDGGRGWRGRQRSRGHEKCPNERRRDGESHRSARRNIETAKGADLKADMSLVNAASVLFDAAYVPGGEKSASTLAADDRAILFVNETFKHCKALAATGAGVGVLRASSIDLDAAESDPALFTDDKSDAKKIASKFIKAIAQHRNWDRETKANIPA